MKAAPRLSEAEWEVMKVVWRRPGCGAQEVVAALARRTAWSEGTVKTLLNRMVRKGALGFEKEGRAYRYSAAAAEQDLRRAESDAFLQRVFDGALPPMLSHFLRSRKLDARTLEELERAVREARGRR
ncbi:MAG TPA: BlaI/MecI/CopY family transcriptional regulator [Opitutaceae bacterium]|nr:BlaI/MecI/CopY family transcriptional regulator [Opitutaceae bacterium]